MGKINELTKHYNGWFCDWGKGSWWIEYGKLMIVYVMIGVEWCDYCLWHVVAEVSTVICISLYHEVNMNYVRPVGINSC